MDLIFRIMYFLRQKGKEVQIATWLLTAWHHNAQKKQKPHNPHLQVTQQLPPERK